jgi:predicted GIY-YIG superfamily endonuclease
MSRTKAAAKPEAQTEASDIKWFVYLLRCGDGSLYTGITNDLNRRFNQHNAGTASRYTRSRLPVVLAYQEPQKSQSHALKRELAIKSLTRPQKESLIMFAEQFSMP